MAIFKFSVLNSGSLLTPFLLQFLTVLIPFSSNVHNYDHLMRFLIWQTHVYFTEWLEQAWMRDSMKKMAKSSYTCHAVSIPPSGHKECECQQYTNSINGWQWHIDLLYSSRSRMADCGIHGTKMNYKLINFSNFKRMFCTKLEFLLFWNWAARSRNS